MWFFSVFLRILLCVYLYFVRKVCDRCYLCDKSVTCWITVLTKQKDVCEQLCDRKSSLWQRPPKDTRQGSVANSKSLWQLCDVGLWHFVTPQNPFIYYTFWPFGTSYYKITKFSDKIKEGCRGVAEDRRSTLSDKLVEKWNSLLQAVRNCDNTKKRCTGSNTWQRSNPIKWKVKWKMIRTADHRQDHRTAAVALSLALWSRWVA